MFYGNPQTVDDVPNMTYIEGDFRGSFLRMHKVITELGYWELIKEDPPKDKGFMFWNAPWLAEIESRCDEHSGGSMACCLRLCQYVARNGWDSFVTALK